MWPLYAKITVLVATLAPLYYISFKFHPEFSQVASTASTSHGLSHDKFQDIWLQTHVLEPFNASAIREYCDEIKWRPNLVFNIPNAVGGIGNVRTNILDFLFFSIEAGASIILPGVMTRDRDNLSELFAGRADFEFYFDEQWFKRALQQACPQMHVHDSIESLGPKVIEEVYFPAVPFSRRHLSGDAWREQTDAWLTYHNVDEDELTVVSVERTMWEVPVRTLSEAFGLALPMVLRTHPSLRRYAAIAMSNLALDHELEISPSLEIAQNAFFGAHLRTETDAIEAGWFSSPFAGWDAQTDAYISGAVAANLSIIYAASGDAMDLDRFKTKAAANDPSLTVLTKWDLLSEDEGKTFAESFHWDQQGLVDLEILWRCSMFGGLASSSFSFTVAITRTAWLDRNNPNGSAVDPWSAPVLNEHVAFANDLNRVVDRNVFNEDRCRQGCWP